MNDQTDSQLLHAYAENRSEAAFTELVRRHVDFVYSAARRMVYDPHLAEDVTQSVFVAFAKNARQLSDRPVVSGWLHRTAQNIAAQTVRTIERRRAREQEAVAMNELLAHESDAAWENIAPHLDTALGELSEPDRDALLLRYFERKSAREIAQTLGTSEEAAQKRVNRAVDRLRELFSKRNVTISASVLMVLLSANVVQSAPIGLVLTISSAVSLASAAVQSAAITAVKTIAMTTLQTILITTAIVVAVGVGIYEARRASHLQTELQALQQEQSRSKLQLDQIRGQLENATKELKLASSANELLRRNTTDLARLRGEVTKLKNSQAQPETNSIGLAAKVWSAKVDSIKQHLEQNPGEGIPELVFADERDWLSSIDPSASYWPLAKEDDYHHAINSLRCAAESRFGSLVAKVLMKYSEANNGRFPQDLSQLQPYCDSAVATTLLQLYKIAPAKIVEDVFPVPASSLVIKSDVRVRGDWVITRKVRVNPNLSSRFAIFPGGTTYWQSPSGTDNQ